RVQRFAPSAWLGLFARFNLIWSNVYHLRLQCRAAHQHRNLKEIRPEHCDILRIVAVEFDYVSPVSAAEPHELKLDEIPFARIFNQLLKLLRGYVDGFTGLQRWAW